MTTQNGCEKFNDVLVQQLVSCLLSGENESRNSANTCKLALFFQMQASSDPVSLQSDVSLLFALFGCNFNKIYSLSFQHTGPFYDGGQFENAVVKLTYGDYNSNTL